MASNKELEYIIYQMGKKNTENGKMVLRKDGCRQKK